MAILLKEHLKTFEQYLYECEKSTNTIEKYLRDVNAFFLFLGPEQEVGKETVLRYKQFLAQRYKTTSANSMLAALNCFLSFEGLHQLRVRQFKVQRRIFRDTDRELNKAEYIRLVKAAKLQGNSRLYMLMQTVCATGIRVSELQYITVDAVKEKRARVVCKGKERIILLPDNLCRSLSQYCRHSGIKSGSIFVTRSGKPLHRTNIWFYMKELCKTAQVDPRKVFPHNFRHLFARLYYQLQKDIVRLADILGHSSIETTRIYTICSGQEQQQSLGHMGLVL